MAAYYEDFEIDQGTDVALQVQLKELNGNARDLTAHNVNAEMKVNYAADSAVAFTAIVANPATDGIITLELTNTQTAALNPRWRYVYDCNLFYTDSDSNTIIETVLRGTIKVCPGV